MRLVSILLFTFFSLNSLASNPIHLPDIIVNGTVMVGSTASPNSKSILDLESTTTGFLPPRMTTTQRNAITSPPLGLAIQNSTTTYPDYYDGSQWQGILSIPSRSTASGILHIATGTVSASSVSLTQDVSGILPTANGGTGQNLSSSTGVLVISSGTVSASSVTASNISGTLGVANGGTGITSGTSGGILGFTASGTIASSAALTVSQLVKGGGAGATPSTFAACSDGQIIKYASGVPACGSDSTGSGTLAYRSVTSTDSSSTSDTVLFLSGASFTEQIYTAVGNTGNFLEIVHNGTDETNLYTLTTTSGQTIGGIASGSYVLHTNGERLKIFSDGANWQILNHQTDAGWKTFSASWVGGTLAFGTNTQLSIWKREGQNMHLRHLLNQTATTGSNAGTAPYRLTLPLSLTINTSFASTSTVTPWHGTALGVAALDCGAAVVGPTPAIGYDSTHITLMEGSSETLFNCTPTTHTNVNVSIEAWIPITGWQP